MKIDQCSYQIYLMSIISDATISMKAASILLAAILGFQTVRVRVNRVILAGFRLACGILADEFIGKDEVRGLP